jgi:hypothetical protein
MYYKSNSIHLVYLKGSRKFWIPFSKHGQIFFLFAQSMIMFVVQIGGEKQKELPTENL